MKDIPFFTTASGVASLTLKEIPYSSTAYVRIQQASDPEGLLNECCDFCIAVGAQCIYAAGHDFLEDFPFHTAIWQMRCRRDLLPDTDACLFPVTQQTLQQWVDIYNSRMKDVPNAAFMSLSDAKKLCDEGGGYFIHRDRQLLGIGVASGDRLDTVISVYPGAGKDVVLALNHTLTSDIVQIEVASENAKAIRLYEKLGFIKTAEISRWYKVR